MAIQLTEKQIQSGWQVVKFGEIAKNISERVEPAATGLEVYVGLEHLDPQSLRINRRGLFILIPATKPYRFLEC